MTKEQKLQFIDILASVLSSKTSSKNIYLTDISNMNAYQIYDLRRSCYISQVKVMMVKNTLLRIAMEKYRKKMCIFFPIFKGSTFIMLSSRENAPAKIIFDYKKKNNSKIPILKAAYVSEIFYIGNDKLDYLVNLKSKEDLIVGIISALQSSLINIIAVLQSPGYNILDIFTKKY